MKLRTVEVPVHFLKDRNGRVSHHRREGWWSPFAAAWINLKAMFIYGSDFFTFKPGFIAVLLGLALCLPLTFGPITIGIVTLSVFWQLLGTTLLTLGLVGVYAGIISKILFDYTGRESSVWSKRFRYTRTTVLSFILISVGVVGVLPILLEYLNNGYELSGISTDLVHLTITSLSLIASGLLSFVFTLIIHASILSSRFIPSDRTA
jgi:hypothetical protein